MRENNGKKRDFKETESRLPQEWFKIYQKRFEKMSNEELVECFNREVKNPGWTGAKGAYLCALHQEFLKRGFDISLIGGEYCLSFGQKVKLAYRPMLVPEETEK